MPGGRPTDYDPAYCEQVIALGREGKSVRQISAAIDVPRRTMDHWAEANEEFRAALTRARELAVAWWENAAQDGTAAQTIGPAVWARMVASQFPDVYNPPQRNEHSGPDGGPIETRSRSDLEDELRKLLARSGKGAEGGGE